MINIGLVLRSAENQAELLRNRNQKPSEPRENMSVTVAYDCSLYQKPIFFCSILIFCI